jgi:hypothetical protein
VPYGHSMHGQEEIDAVVEVLKGNTALGDKTKEFEGKIAALFGKKYGVMVNSGSSANMLALELFDLKPGDEVITPDSHICDDCCSDFKKASFQFLSMSIMTPISSILTRLKSYHQENKSFNDPITHGKYSRYGSSSKIAKKHKLWFIEDSCDTLGAKFKGKPTGVYSHISTTSFYGSHIINGAGGGGMIMVNDKKWADRLVVLRGWGRQSSLFGEKQNSELIENRFEPSFTVFLTTINSSLAKLATTFFRLKFLPPLPLPSSSAFRILQKSGHRTTITFSTSSRNLKISSLLHDRPISQKPSGLRSRSSLNLMLRSIDSRSLNSSKKIIFRHAQSLPEIF